MAQSKLQKTIEGILKDYNAGLIFGNQSTIPEYPPMSTGFPGLDLAISRTDPGLPPGRWIELFGPEMAGKSTLAIAMLAEGQRRGEITAYMDIEHRIQTKYFEALGMKIDETFVICQPDTGEEAFDIIKRFVRDADVKRIVVDSVAALVAQAETEGGPAAQKRLGLQAAMLSQSCRVLTPILSAAGAMVIMVNQLRENIGAYGSSEKTTGGRALRHYASTRIRISRAGAPEKWGHNAKCAIKKNSVGEPFSEWHGRLVYGKGFDRMYDILTLAVQLGIVSKKGNWYHHQGQQIGCGLEQVRTNLEEDAETMDLIVKDIEAWSK